MNFKNSSMNFIKASSFGSVIILGLNISETNKKCI